MESGKEIIGESSGGRPKADIWKHVTILDEKRVKCNYCQFRFARSANRIKLHLDQIEGKGIRVCTQFPQPNNESNISSGSLQQNLINSQGSPILDRPKDHNKLNEKMLDCYKSPKTMWEGMTQQQVQMNTKSKQQGMKQVGPFSVSNTVDAHDLLLIEYVFDPSLQQREIIFSSSHSYLNRNEFTTLGPRSLLDSRVIDVFAEYLTDIERKKRSSNLNCYLPIMFSTLALRANESSLLDFLERQKMREQYFPKLLDCVKIFIPVHIDKDLGHFYLYVIYLKSKEIEIWDPFPSFTNEKEHRERAQKLILALNISFMDDIWYSSWTFSNFLMRMAKDTPLQPNEHDCGIFVINFMQQSANGKRNYFSQFHSDEERLDLVLKLLKSDLNKQRETLYVKVAQRHPTTDRHLFGLKRKDVDICRGFPNDIQTEEDATLDYSNKRGKNNVSVIGVQENLDHFYSQVALKRGYEKGYPLPTTGLIGGQFQNYIEQIREWLMKDEVSVIGVWGMGGVGKTALISHIHNQLLESDEYGFEHVIWITVSQHSDIRQLQKAIAKSINLDLSDEFEEKRMAGRLLSAFNQINKCVLILDDVYDHIFLNKVGFPVSKNGIKLILTTRSWEVCKGLNCKDNIIRVEPLEDEESWDLFNDTLGKTLPDEVEEIAEDVTDECAGLPLAIITIARSMMGKEDIREWNHKLESLKNLENGQYDMDRWVFPILRCSYEKLDDCKLQKCFLCCAVYSEEDGNSVEDFTRSFVVEGLIDEKKGLEEQYNESYSILNKLKNNNLLEEEENSAASTLRVNRLIRGMAISIVKETTKIMLGSYKDLTEVPDDDEWKEDLQKVFLAENDIREIPYGTSPNCSKLTTLLLHRNYNLKLIADDFFVNMSALKVLNLSGTSISHLPKSVSNLKCLFALLLNKCKSLRYVPSLSKLQKLMWLDLFRTAITEAPEGLEMLINLRHLDLRGTEASFKIGLVIARLKKLQSLHLDCTPGLTDLKAQELLNLKKLESISKHFCDIKEYKFFLEGNRGLFSYDLRSGSESAEFYWPYVPIVTNVNNSVIFSCVESENTEVLLPENVKVLVIDSCDQWGRCLCNVLLFKNNCKIRYCVIEKCLKLEYLFCMSADCTFCPSLQFVGELELRDLKGIQVLCDDNNMATPAPALPSITPFSHLRYLKIERCKGIKKLMTPELSAQFQNLEIVTIDDCESIKEIFAVRSGEEEDEEEFDSISKHSEYIISLPKLRHLWLYNLPELHSLYKGIMICPSLRIFNITYCSKLKSLPEFQPALQINKTPTGWEIF